LQSAQSAQSGAVPPGEILIGSDETTREPSMFSSEFVPAAPRYPEQISVAVPRGTRSAVARAAERQQIPHSELLRRVIAEAIAEAGQLEPKDRR
jgi:hypothetical protein